jgi:hypothetical protein
MYHEEHFTNYLTPVPTGMKSVMFRVTGGWYGPGQVRFLYHKPLEAFGNDAFKWKESAHHGTTFS